MNKTDILLIGGVAAGIYLMLKIFSRGTSKAAPGQSVTAPGWSTMITQADGWQYYSDGTSIGPDGKYYKGSDLIYDPAGMYQQ